MQLIHLAKLQYIRHVTHSITSQYMYAYASNKVVLIGTQVTGLCS
jgi:hypothetical protein